MSSLNRRVACGNRSGRNGSTLDTVSEKIERTAKRMANHGCWTKCGLIPGKSCEKTSDTSELRLAGVVEWEETDGLFENRKALIIPDVRLEKVMAAADRMGAGEGLYLSEDGLLCHYDSMTGMATPCLEMNGRYAFREDFSVPFRGKEIGWEELEGGLENAGTGRG